MRYSVWTTSGGGYPMESESNLTLVDALRRMADWIESARQHPEFLHGDFQIRNIETNRVFQATVKSDGAVSTWDPSLSMICPGPHG